MTKVLLKNFFSITLYLLTLTNLTLKPNYEN